MIHLHKYFEDRLLDGMFSNTLIRRLSMKIEFDKSIDGISNVFSFVLVVISLILTNYVNRNVPLEANVFSATFGLIIPILNVIQIKEIYVFRKLFIDNRAKLKLGILISSLGIIEIIIQYITTGKNHGIHQYLTSIILIPVLIYYLCDYLYTFNLNTKIIDKIYNKVTFVKIRLYISASVAFLFAHWYSYERNNFSRYSLFANMLYDLIVIVIILILCTYIYLVISYLAKNRKRYPDYKIHISFNDIFPFKVIFIAATTIIAWGISMFLIDNAVIEVTFYISIGIIISISAIWGLIIITHIGVKPAFKDKFKLFSTMFILVTYSFFVYATVYLKGTINHLNRLGVITSAIILMGYVVFVYFLGLK